MKPVRLFCLVERGENIKAPPLKIAQLVTATFKFWLHLRTKLITIFHMKLCIYRTILCSFY